MPTPSDDKPKVLILGGTAEALALAQTLVAAGDVSVITSLAGRTAEPVLPPGEVRVGGFGGADGLAAYIRAHGISRVIDATHPFARRISENAIRATTETGVPLEYLVRPGWERQRDDRWQEVSSLEEAARALPAGATVFLALGRQYLDAFVGRGDCRFVIRMVDPPAETLPFANHVLILGKPSADPATEAGLLAVHGITHLVCRNSGGAAGYGKIAAARQMGLPVVMVERAE